MQGIAGIIWLIVLAVIVSRVNSKKVKKAQAARKREAERTADWADSVMRTRPQEKAKTEKAKEPERFTSSEGRDPCHEEMLSGKPARPHLPEERGSAFMEEFTDVHSEEGADPCHDELYQRPDAPVIRKENGQDTEMNPIVQGIIWSAILQRPSVRARR